VPFTLFCIPYSSKNLCSILSMRSVGPSSMWMAICAVWIWQITYASAYFIIQNPGNGTQFVNNAANVITWTKGVDNIMGFDLEMTRMSKDGLSLIARNVPSKPSTLYVYIENVPPGDDYFFLFINSTIGQMYAISSTFSIVAADTTPSVTPPSPVDGVPTVTVSGTPVPTPLFATTFPTLPSGAVALFTSNQINALLLMLLSCAFGASLTLGW